MDRLESILMAGDWKRWALALAVFVGSFVALRIVRSALIKRLNRTARETETTLDDLLLTLLRRTQTFFLFSWAVLFGLTVLKLSSSTDQALQKAIILITIIQAALWGNSIVSFGISNYARNQGMKDAASTTTLGLVSFLAKFAFLSLLVLLALNNLGVDITALVAGLGVGGVAIALAVQNILGDLFASLTIVLDQPFVVGDFIVVGEYMGTIERIGLKTTRIRSLSGEQLVFSNADLLQSRIRNFKRMQERRVVFALGVTYQTPLEKLREIPRILQEIVETTEQTRFDRAHFKGFGASSLDYEVVYWVKSAEFNLYMDIQQAINLEIFRRFEAERIEFAYPTRTLHVVDGTPSLKDQLDRSLGPQPGH